MKQARGSRHTEIGPFRVEHLRPGDPYELSHGHAIASEPAGPRHGEYHLLGGAVIASDPAVAHAGVDVGFALDASTLRAPDVAVAHLPAQASFVSGAPALALEYVETGADERDLTQKITELLGAGTALVWAVRLGHEPTVEVHRPGVPPEVKRRGETLVAPGILRNPVPVDALYDPVAAHALILRNELERQGYTSLDAVRAESATNAGLAQARAAVRQVLHGRDFTLDARHDAVVGECQDLATLERWLQRAIRAGSIDDVFA